MFIKKFFLTEPKQKPVVAEQPWVCLKNDGHREKKLAPQATAGQLSQVRCRRELVELGI